MDASGFPLILQQGVDGIVVRFSDKLSDAANQAALAFRADLERDTISGVLETSTALASMFARFDPEKISAEALQAILQTRLNALEISATALSSERRLWTVPVHFGGTSGPNFADVAARAGLSEAAAISDLTSRPVRVLTIGFAPGMPYMGELGSQWDIPRLSELIHVPEGALVLAIRQLIIFANPSPTGWSHIGQTAFRCFRPEQDDPFALRPGDEVALYPVDRARFEALSEMPDGGATCEPLP